MNDNLDPKRAENQLSDTIPDLEIIRGAILTLSNAIDCDPPADYFGFDGQIRIFRVALKEISETVNLAINDLTALMPEQWQKEH